MHLFCWVFFKIATLRVRCKSFIEAHSKNPPSRVIRAMVRLSNCAAFANPDLIGGAAAYMKVRELRFVQTSGVSSGEARVFRKRHRFSLKRTLVGNGIEQSLRAAGASTSLARVLGLARRRSLSPPAYGRALAGTRAAPGTFWLAAKTPPAKTST